MADHSKKIKLPMYVAPEPWAVLYVHPMDGRFKDMGRKCWNCFMWASEEERCTIHPKDLEIHGWDVCGYHVPGNPLKKLSDLPNHESIQPVDPEVSGLEHQIPETGTMCGNCRFYTPSETKPQHGFCASVAKQNDKLPLYQAKVAYYGCCTRWENQ